MAESRRPRSPFSRARKRIREIERVVADRHGRVPETDDCDIYLRHVAHCFRKIVIDRGKPATAAGIMKTFGFWCRTWAPNIGDQQLMEIVREVARSRKFPADDAVGKDLRLSYADRRRLKITAIGSYDTDRAARTRLAKARKKERDRLRAAEKRKAAGATPRAESLSQTQPWKLVNKSRATYYRDLKRARETDSSPHPSSYSQATNLSQTPDVATPSPLPVVVLEQPVVVSREEPQATTRRAPDVIDVVGVAWRAPPPIDHLARGAARARRILEIQAAGGVR
jgi:hypothetical protein